ncbi:hypothetical protein P4S64_12250 [Vibrio sp. M60_M31a]
MNRDAGKSVTTSAISSTAGQTRTALIQGKFFIIPRWIWKVDITTLHPRSEEMRNLRRFNFSLVSQEPMAALSPVPHTVGDQIIKCFVLLT